MSNSRTLREQLAELLMNLHISYHKDLMLGLEKDSTWTVCLKTKIDNIKGIMNTPLYKALDGNGEKDE